MTGQVGEPIFGKCPYRHSLPHNITESFLGDTPILQTDYNYELTFYARPNGVISKTLVKKNYDAENELKWK